MQPKPKATEKGSAQHAPLKLKCKVKKKLQAADIDEIFAQHCQKKPNSGLKAAQFVPTKSTKSSGSFQNKKNPTTTKKSVGSRDDLFGDNSKQRQRTEEGWPIYTEEELGLTKGGGNTDKCPFDCNCCF